MWAGSDFVPEVFGVSSGMLSSLFLSLSSSCWQEALLFRQNIIFTQLLFQCWIQFQWFRQAEIFKGQDLPHGSLALRAAALCNPVSPGPLQPHGWRGSNTPPYLAVAHVHIHRPPKWNPPAASSDYYHRREKGGDAGADRDAQFAQRGCGSSERGALLRLGESFSEGFILVPQPDALLLPQPAHGGKDAGLLHL